MTELKNSSKNHETEKVKEHPVILQTDDLTDINGGFSIDYFKEITVDDKRPKNKLSK